MWKSGSYTSRLVEEEMGPADSSAGKSRETQGNETWKKGENKSGNNVQEMTVIPDITSVELKIIGQIIAVTENSTEAV